MGTQHRQRCGGGRALNGSFIHLFTFISSVLTVLTLSLPSCLLKDLALWVIRDLCHCSLFLTHHSPFLLGVSSSHINTQEAIPF